MYMYTGIGLWSEFTHVIQRAVRVKYLYFILKENESSATLQGEKAPDQVSAKVMMMW